MVKELFQKIKLYGISFNERKQKEKIKNGENVSNVDTSEIKNMKGISTVQQVSTSL